MVKQSGLLIAARLKNWRNLNQNCRIVQAELNTLNAAEVAALAYLFSSMKSDQVAA